MRSILFFIIIFNIINIYYVNCIKKEKEKELEKVTINKSDYCQGCIETVNVYANRLVNGLVKYESNSIVEGTLFAAESIIDKICDDEHFDTISISLKHACIKIISDNSTSFMQNFEGKLDKNFNKVKGIMFDLKKKVCLNDVKACSISTFNKGNITSKNRIKCSACHIIANDIDISIKKYINVKNKNNNIIEDIVENICDNIGFNHSPYSWIEDYCEDIIEDNYSTIVDASKFRKKLYVSKFNPDETFSDSLCEELYKCKKIDPKRKTNEL